VTTHIVQDCGCIALPEDLQRKSGHGPGASFEFHVAEDGSNVTLSSIHPSQSVSFGTSCGIPATQSK
jgi:hypothetical protein